MEIAVPKPAPMDDRAKTNFATEIAFSSLLNSAAKHGLGLLPCMGLLYLPDESVTRQFQDACRAVIECLSPKAPPEAKT